MLADLFKAPYPTRKFEYPDGWADMWGEIGRMFEARVYCQEYHPMPVGKKNPFVRTKAEDPKDEGIWHWNQPTYFTQTSQSNLWGFADQNASIIRIVGETDPVPSRQTTLGELYGSFATFPRTVPFSVALNGQSNWSKTPSNSE